MNRVRAHFGRRSGRRQLGRAFLTAFGMVWLVAEPAGLFFPNTFDWGWEGYLGLVIVSGFFAGYVARPRSKISRALPPTNVVISVSVGDLLAQHGNIIVGANDTFDTQLEDGVISPRSVQGQLLGHVFGGDRAVLDHQIEASVLTAAGASDPAKTFGKRVRYPIGTIAVVQRGDDRFFLAAFCRMSNSMPAHVGSSIEDLQVALARTWEEINAAGQREPVHIPVLGSNLARLGVTHTLLIQMIVLSFIAARPRGASELTVWIADADRDTVDLAMLDQWLHGLCAA